MKLIFTVWLLLLGGVSAAWASGGGETVEMVPFFSSNFLWTCINFALVVFLLTKFGKAPMKEALRARKEKIAHTMNEAAEARSLAEKALKEVEQRLSEKDATVKTILDESRETAEREEQLMIDQAEKASLDIVERARGSVDVELKKAMDQLKAEAVRLALETAEQKIAGMMTSEDQKRLVNQYITGMENRN